MLKLNTNVWDRQSGESSRSWSGFVVYRDLPPEERTIQKVAETIQKTPSLVRRWSAENNWVSRVSEYDQHLDREIVQKERIEAERKKIEMLARHTNTLVFVQNKAVERFLAITDDEWDKIPIQQLTSLYLDAAKFERVSRGLPSDSIELEAATPERFRQRSITEGKLFLHEIMHDFPNLPEKKCLEIICAEFDVSASDLGYDQDELDLLDEKMRLTVADEYPEEFED
jgi:hypothetical protein